MIVGLVLAAWLSLSVVLGLLVAPCLRRQPLVSTSQRAELQLAPSVVEERLAA